MHPLSSKILKRCVEDVRDVLTVTPESSERQKGIKSMHKSDNRSNVLWKKQKVKVALVRGSNTYIDSCHGWISVICRMKQIFRVKPDIDGESHVG